jgi:hypothetical protein
MLDTERAFFDSIQQNLLTVCPGQFVLIKGKEMVGTHSTIQEAFAEGARRFGLESFLVRRVDGQTETVSIPALALGILSANPSPTIRRPGAEA